MSNIATTLRRLVAVLATCVVALVLTATVTPAANAVSIGSSGQSGPYSIARPQCWNRPAWGQLELKAPVPSLYAVNAKAGAGNDSQYVRYAVHVYNMKTASYVFTSTYSGFVVAKDNAPAAFSGAALSVKVPSNGRYRLVYQLEWFSPTTGALSGRTYDEVQQYNYYNAYGAGPIGPTDSCMNVG